MKCKLLNNDGQKTYVVVFETGDEIMQGLMEVANQENLGASTFTAIGACSEATLGFFDFETKDYQKTAIKEQVEVLTLAGDITLFKEQPKIHAHIVLGKKDGTAYGGHLISAIVHPTLEVILIESPVYLHRKTDKETGLPLIEI